jgi:hypothetical protein
MTWGKLAECEPALNSLLRDAQTVDGSDEYFCANLVWARELKPRLVELVGYWARNPELRNTRAYEIAYRRIYDALPPCRNCGCITLVEVGVR